jgi:NADH:ubiquinone oxidoreductase subunit 3 (subunit A)
MMRTLVLSPLFAFAAFMGLAYGLYRVGGKLGARGEETPGKRQPYACGEDLSLSQTTLTYHAFFKLALMFGILHLATLVVATLPASATSRRLATLYLAGIGISVLALTEGEL